MDEFCFSTRSRYEAEYMFQWCQWRQMNPVMLPAQDPQEYTLRISGIPRNDSRYVALLVQLTRIPGAWHFEEHCPS
jgi:hypothetical protein